MTTTPVVSVLMAVYNAQHYLEKALDSLLHQTLCDIEVLAVDDCSTDNSLSLLQHRACMDGRLRVFRQSENQGQAVARNLALREARGEFVCMVDADDWLSPDALETAVAQFRAYPQTDCVVFRLMRHWDADGHEELWPEKWLPDACLTGEEACRLSFDWTLHGLYLVRRDLHMRYPFDETYRLFSDDNTTRLHYLHSREVRFCLGIYYWRQHAESSTTAVSPRLFLYMLANQSMTRLLRESGASPSLMAAWERQRWYNYLGQLWLWFRTKHELTAEERRDVLLRFRQVYASFTGHIRPFRWLYWEQWLRFHVRTWRNQIFSVIVLTFIIYS